MFVLTLGNTNESDKMLDEIKSYQIDVCGQSKLTVDSTKVQFQQQFKKG